MRESIKTRLAELRDEFERQSAELRAAKQTLRSIDPDKLLSVSERWLSEFDAATDVQPQTRCVMRSAIRA